MSQSRISLFARKQDSSISFLVFIVTLFSFFEAVETQTDPLKELFLKPEASFADSYDLLGNVAYIGLAQFIIFCESHYNLKEYKTELNIINQLGVAGDYINFESVNASFPCSNYCVDKDILYPVFTRNNCHPEITYNNRFHCAGWETAQEAENIRNTADELIQFRNFLMAFEKLKKNITDKEAYSLLVDLGQNLKLDNFNGILYNATNIFNYNNTAQQLINFITSVKPALRREYSISSGKLKNPVTLVTKRNKEGFAEKIHQSKNNNHRNFFIAGYGHCITNRSYKDRFLNLRNDNIRPALQESLQDVTHAIVMLKR